MGAMSVVILNKKTITYSPTFDFELKLRRKLLQTKTAFVERITPVLKRNFLSDLFNVWNSPLN